jgi:hypothetical protein
MSGSHFPSELFIARFTQSFSTEMLKSIERVLAHLILPSLSKSKGLLSSRQATVQPSNYSIGSLNVKDKCSVVMAVMWKTQLRFTTPPMWFEREALLSRPKDLAELIICNISPPACRSYRFPPDMFYVNEFAERLKLHDDETFEKLFG